MKITHFVKIFNKYFKVDNYIENCIVYSKLSKYDSYVLNKLANEVKEHNEELNRKKEILKRPIVIDSSKDNETNLTDDTETNLTDDTEIENSDSELTM